MITFKSVGHFLAKAFTAVKSGLIAIEGTEKTVETVTGVIPGGQGVVLVERAAYALLGEVSALLGTGDAAVTAKLADAGLDSAVVSQVKDLLKQFPELIAIAKSL